MPYAWTHLTFGHQLLAEANLPSPKDKYLFQLGCQGPDFFFFHYFWKLHKQNVGAELGELFHNQHCGAVLVELIEAVRTTPSLKEYVMGFITHYILDSFTHPYIHYRAGYKKFKHQKLEVIIDTLVAKKVHQVETWRTPLTPEIDIGHLPEELVQLFHQIVQKYYPQMGTRFSIHHYDQAYQHMKKAFSLFYDPSGIKELFTFGLITPFRHKKKFPSFDYLNEEHRIWRHPADLDETSKASFWDLWKDALQEGKRVLPAIVAYWQSGKRMESPLLTLVQNRSYDHGKDCSLQLERRYSDPIV